jgi:hypothetical protein
MHCILLAQLAAGFKWVWVGGGGGAPVAASAMLQLSGTSQMRFSRVTILVDRAFFADPMTLVFVPSYARGPVSEVSLCRYLK